MTAEGNMAEANLSRLHIIVEGRVQGVGFRFFVVENAQRLNLTGWVRNRWNGSVESIAEGNRHELDKFIADIRRGPRSSMVLGVKINWKDATGEFRDFRVKPTI
jgi:acylphosphatase